jgi:hypothetical protein
VPNQTSPALTAAEEAVAAEAVQNVLASDIPSWERSLIPQATLTKAINAAVAAIDKLRNRAAQQPPKTPPPPPPSPSSGGKP